jgi:hypothetical protein
MSLCAPLDGYSPDGHSQVADSWTRCSCVAAGCTSTPASEPFLVRGLGRGVIRHVPLPSPVAKAAGMPQPPSPASATGGGMPAATAHAPGSFVAAQMAAAPPLHPDWQLGSVLLILPLLSTEQQ